MKIGLNCLVAVLLWVSTAQGNQSCLLPLLAAASSSERFEIKLPTSLSELEGLYSGLSFATRRQNRAYRKAFENRNGGTTLAVSIDFPLVTQLNNLLNDKPKTAAVFHLYKRLLFAKLKKDPIWNRLRKHRNGIELVYADYKNIGLVFDTPTQEIRATVENRLRELHKEVAEDFFQATEQIAELKILSGIGKTSLVNRRNWFHFGFGSNPMEATIVSRLARYHSTAEGVPPILSFSERSVQLELRQKFYDVEGVRKSILAEVEIPRKNNRAWSAMVMTLNSHDAHHHPSGKVLSDRVWDILRKVKANNEQEYLSFVRDSLFVEFGVKDVSDEFIRKLQKYYHLLDTFLPRVHERREMSISIKENAPGGAIYVDVRGQTPRNLFRMANELQLFAETGELERPDLVSRVAEAVRYGQDSASRSFQKIRKLVRRHVGALGVESEVRVSGDEIAVLLKEKVPTEVFRSYVQRLAESRLPVRPIFVTGQAHLIGGEHVSRGEEIEKAIRQKLKEESSGLVTRWEEVTIGVEIDVRSEESNRVRLYVAEAPGTGMASRAKALLDSFEDDGTLYQLFPRGYHFLESRIANGPLHRPEVETPREKIRDIR